MSKLGFRWAQKASAFFQGPITSTCRKVSVRQSSGKISSATRYQGDMWKPIWFAEAFFFSSRLSILRGFDGTTLWRKRCARPLQNFSESFQFVVYMATWVKNQKPAIQLLQRNDAWKILITCDPPFKAPSKILSILTHCYVTILVWFSKRLKISIRFEDAPVKDGLAFRDGLWERGHLEWSLDTMSLMCCFLHISQADGPAAPAAAHLALPRGGVMLEVCGWSQVGELRSYGRWPIGIVEKKPQTFGKLMWPTYVHSETLRSLMLCRLSWKSDRCNQMQQLRHKPEVIVQLRLLFGLCWSGHLASAAAVETKGFVWFCSPPICFFFMIHSTLFFLSFASSLISHFSHYGSIFSSLALFLAVSFLRDFILFQRYFEGVLKIPVWKP